MRTESLRPQLVLQLCADACTKEFLLSFRRLLLTYSGGILVRVRLMKGRCSEIVEMERGVSPIGVNELVRLVAPLGGTIEVPGVGDSVLDQAIEQFADAVSHGDFDSADRWGQIAFGTSGDDESP